ncbi:major facilitator superfamily domain-containing protein [Hyaloraphidium curvatum]|nr:major facilitator superfamily domain-containing protein [Hyaloraphidium curvatum]
MLRDGGYSNATGAALVAAFSATVALGRIVGGFFTDRVGEINMWILACAVPFLATSLIWLPAPTNLATTIAASMLWALFCGTPLVGMPILAVIEFGIDNLGAVVGVLYLSFFPGEAFGTAICGSIIDANTIYVDGQRVGADYRPVLGFMAGMWLIGGMLMAVLRWKKVKWKLRIRV